MMTSYESSMTESSRFLKSHFGSAPDWAIVLGSGLSDFVSELKDAKTLPFDHVPGGFASSVQGHQGFLAVGSLAQTKVAVFAGRVHGYEGHRPQEVVHLLRSVCHWGAKKWILTNATGSTSLALRPGRLVIIKDQINLTGTGPLEGKELFGGRRFPDMSDLYSRAWRKQLGSIARSLKIKIRDGVYAGVRGPHYETPAEVRMLKKLGGDIVGMSTVWEALALKQMDAQIAGLSCVSNYCAGISKTALTHDEVLKMAARVKQPFKALIREFISKA